MTDTTTFVLVHGSWQGAWSWDGVRDHLRARGHRVIAPALPGTVDQDECLCVSHVLQPAGAALPRSSRRPAMLPGARSAAML